MEKMMQQDETPSVTYGFKYKTCLFLVLTMHNLVMWFARYLSLGS